MSFNFDDPEKLRLLAVWLDLKDKSSAHTGNEVQIDLRRIADVIEAKMPALYAAYQDDLDTQREAARRMVADMYGGTDD
jgi:hypothetical protein